MLLQYILPLGYKMPFERNEHSKVPTRFITLSQKKDRNIIAFLQPFF